MPIAPKIGEATSNARAGRRPRARARTRTTAVAETTREKVGGRPRARRRPPIRFSPPLGRRAGCRGPPSSASIVIAERARDPASSFSSAPCASRRALHDSISGFLGRPKPKAQGSIWRYNLYFQKKSVTDLRMEDEENVVWSASQSCSFKMERWRTSYCIMTCSARLLTKESTSSSLSSSCWSIHVKMCRWPLRIASAMHLALLQVQGGS